MFTFIDLIILDSVYTTYNSNNIQVIEIIGNNTKLEG